MAATCDACTRPVADQAYLCAACSDELEQAVAEIPGLWDELQTTITRQAKTGGGVGSRSAEKPVPFHVEASAAAGVVADTVGAWAREFTDRPVIGPTCPDRCAHGSCTAIRVLRQPAGVPGMAWRLLAAVGRIRHDRQAAAAHDELVHCQKLIRWTIDRAPDRWYAGRCGLPDDKEQCPGELYAVAGAKYVRCPVCGTDYYVADRRAWLLAAAQDALLTAAELSRALPNLLDQQLSPGTIRSWASRGQLAAHATDREGRPLYRVGDVVDLVANQTRRPA